MNKILFKIYGALSKDSFNDICDNFGIGIVENMVASRRNKLLNVTAYLKIICAN